MMNYLGDNIRLTRKQKKMTQQHLAEKIGSKKNYIWKLENDTPIDPSFSKVVKIADALEVSVDALLRKSSPNLDEELDLITFEEYKMLDQDRRRRVKEFISLIKQ